MSSKIIVQPPATSLATTAAAQADVLRSLLDDKRSDNTRRAYSKDLQDFFRFLGSAEPSVELVNEFLGLERLEAKALVLSYKSYLLREKKLKEATINRRLAAIKALVNFAFEIGKCDYTLTDIRGEKVVPYRDTTGVSKELFRRMLAVPERSTLKGKRDYAILRLLWDNALRRSEVVGTNIQDLDADRRSLLILGKGQGSSKQAITLSRSTVSSIVDWLQARRELDVRAPLFIALDRSSYGHRLTGEAIYKLVETVAKAAGISKKLSPHRIRHSVITAALDATGGDVRKVQKLSRHVNLNTLIIYDDNRVNVQGELSDLLADLV
jgi:integrase/recombinase XerC